MKDNEQPPIVKRSKKTYSQPHLQVYGDLRDITQAIGRHKQGLGRPEDEGRQNQLRIACVYSLAGYGQMVADKIRTDAYAQALKQQIKTGDVVVDIGTGTGILALLACRFGARRVYAFEPSGIIELAREIAAANGFADRIEFIPKMSTESSLPEPVNVMVSDIHGILPFFGKSLVSLIDARERFLAPGGRMIPSSDTLWIAGISAPETLRETYRPLERQAIRI